MLPKAIQITPSYIVPIDAALIWFACIYEFSLSIGAMRHKNNLLLFAVCVSNVFAVAFAAMQYPSLKGFCKTMPEQRAMYNEPLVDITRNIWPQIRGPQLAIPIFIGIFTLSIWWHAFQLHKQYTWSIYRSVQGDSRIRARHLAYEVNPQSLLGFSTANYVIGLCRSCQIRCLFCYLLYFTIRLNRCPLHRAGIRIDYVNSTSPGIHTDYGSLRCSQGAQTTNAISDCKKCLIFSLIFQSSTSADRNRFAILSSSPTYCPGSSYCMETVFSP